MDYQDLNSKTFDNWNKQDWEWGREISHETFLKAKEGIFELKVSPTKNIPSSWLKDIKNKKVLGLASGGGQQMPILAALGASITLLDYSDSQIEKDRQLALKEGYKINIIKHDMSKGLPFKDNEFDMIINPPSLNYIEEIDPLFKEIFRVLKRNGIYIAGFENGFNYAFDESEETAKFKLPFNPLKDKNLYNLSILNDWGIQFSHTTSELLSGILKSGLTILDCYEDYNGYGKLNDLHVPTFLVIKAKK